MIQEKPNMVSSGLVLARCAISQYVVVDVQYIVELSPAVQDTSKVIGGEKNVKNLAALEDTC